MRALRCLLSVASLVVYSGGSLTAADYPLTLVADARAETAAAKVSAEVKIQVDRLMEENRRTRVTDALRYSGYANFVNALRALPSIGSIQLASRTVPIRYAHEQADGSGRRLVLVADRPLFFLGDTAKPKAGYELTLVELKFDAQGGRAGTMMGAARVKPSPDGIVVDDFAEVAVQLAIRANQP